MVSRHQQQRLTYRALDEKSNALARGLLEVGVKKGDRIAVSLGNNLEYAIVCSLGMIDEQGFDNMAGYVWDLQDRSYSGRSKSILFRS